MMIPINMKAFGEHKGVHPVCSMLNSNVKPKLDPRTLAPRLKSVHIAIRYQPPTQCAPLHSWLWYSKGRLRHHRPARLCMSCSQRGMLLSKIRRWRFISKKHVEQSCSMFLFATTTFAKARNSEQQATRLSAWDCRS